MSNQIPNQNPVETLEIIEHTIESLKTSVQISLDEINRLEIQFESLKKNKAIALYTEISDNMFDIMIKSTSTTTKEG